MNYDTDVLKCYVAKRQLLRPLNLVLTSVFYFLQQVIAMSNDDRQKMEDIRKFSAIYGRFDCKRKPEKPLTLHEVTCIFFII